MRVGQIVEVRDDELFPADILFLHTSLPASICFIKTTNLDGETNLKTRTPLALKDEGAKSPEVRPLFLAAACLFLPVSIYELFEFGLKMRDCKCVD